MSFGSPQHLAWLVLILPAMALLAIVRRHARASWRAYDLGRLGPTGRLSTWARTVRLTALFTLALGSLVLALAGPRLDRETRRPVFKTLDVVFLLDTSLSMRARDIAPTRLERARDEIRRLLVDRAPAVGRIGLVTFAGSSVILSYLTRDVSSILFYLDRLQPDVTSGYGTDIARGVANAVGLVEKERALDPALQPADVIFVLVSDGEDHGQRLQQVVADAAAGGYRVYAVGLGSQAGAFIPVRAAGGRTQFLTDERGARVLATFDEGTLRWIADATGGEYYRAYAGGELSEKLADILSRARRQVRVETVREVEPVTDWFLGAAVLLLGLFLIEP